MAINDTLTAAFIEAMWDGFNIDLLNEPVTPTQTALDAFVQTHGPATSTKEVNGLTVHVWSGHERRSIFDLCAGNLYVVGFGDDSLAHVERNVWKRCQEAA
jgi:hypothetical protein